MEIPSTKKLTEEKVNEIIVKDNMEILPSVQSPSYQVADAIKHGATLEHLAVLEKGWEFDLKVKAQQAKEAYHNAMAGFNEEAPPLKKDKINSQYKVNGKPARYTSVPLMLDTYRPVLAKHGLRIRFSDPKIEEDQLSITAIVSHKLGHEEKTPITLPIIKPAVGKVSGQSAMNPAQAIKATFTYARSMAIEAALGVAGSDATLDTDGNYPNDSDEPISNEQENILLKMIEESSTTEKFFTRFMKVENLSDLPESRYQEAIDQLVALGATEPK